MAVSAYPWENARRSSFQLERWSWTLRWWLFVAVVLAGAFHWWLFYFFDNLEQGRRLMPQREAEKPRRERVAISPDLLKQQEAIKYIPDKIAESNRPEPQVKARLEDIIEMLPKDKALDLTPQVDKITNFKAPNPTAANTPAQSPSLAAIASSIPGPDIMSAAAALKSSTLSKAVSSNQLVIPSKALDKQLEGIDSQLLDRLNAQNQAGNGAPRTLPGYSNLDAIISNGGKVSSSTAPIAIPTDLLFEFGSDTLAETARLSMMKLGYLIQKNPNSRFIIEGHTDNFDSVEYNRALGQRRANAVLQYLMNALHISTDRIEAIGIGKARLIVPGDRSIEEQAPNRRVEIRIVPLR